ncbi:MAG: hypothetical protein KY393_00235 [Actinobacteria bacterium]|nr:hypothetical protein [Actinomycetota bacterium]
MNLAAHIPGEPHLFGWYLGFAIAFAIIVVIVVEVQAILMLARKIGTQAQSAIEGLEQIFTNTTPLADLQTTVNHARAIVEGMLGVRKGLGG